MQSIFIKQLVLTATIVVTSFFYFADRYHIAVDTQDKPCLNQRYFFIDTWAQPSEFDQGELMAYRFHLESALIPHNRVILKRVVGLPQHSVTFDAYHGESDNKRFRGDVSDEMARLNVVLPANAKINLGENDFFLMGTTKWSYDSRFWGKATANNVVGKGYALF